MNLYAITPGFQLQHAAAKSKQHGSHENPVYVALSQANNPAFASQKTHLLAQQQKPYLTPAHNTGFSVVG